MQMQSLSPVTSRQIESQIKALEFALSKAKNPYPLQSKIKSLREKLETVKRFEFLAR